MIYMRKVMKAMDNLGYAESTSGTQLIRDAVQIVDKTYRVMMCKDVYPELARKYGMTPAAVERAMRGATEKAMRSPSWEWHWRELGGVNPPTNAEVIMRLARECGDRYKEDNED